MVSLSLSLSVLTCDCNFSADDGVNRGPSVPHHEEELAVGEEFSEVVTRLECEGILVINVINDWRSVMAVKSPCYRAWVRARRAWPQPPG